jgi:protein-tyrosine-phosphatase
MSRWEWSRRKIQSGGSLRSGKVSPCESQSGGESRGGMTQKNESTFRLLFVCTGNTCRSPMAEGILRKALKARGVENVEVRSAGTHGLDLAPVSVFAAAAAKAVGVDISRHHSRQLDQRMIEKADLILVMSPQHAQHIGAMNRAALKKTCLLKSFPHPVDASNVGREPGVLSIKDPMGGVFEDYQRSCLEIEEQINRILPEILRRAKKD